jgi:hypothetical protein
MKKLVMFIIVLTWYGEVLGQTTFARTYGRANFDNGYFAQQTNDGGFIIAGSTNSVGAGGYDVLLVKTDANGNVLWARTYGGTSDDEARSVQQTSDGGFIVAGRTYSFGAGSGDALLIKTDASGNVSWARTFGGSGNLEEFFFAREVSGGFIAVGQARSFGAGLEDFFVVRTDFSGNVLWARTYGGNNSDYAYSALQTSDGGFIIAGYTYSFGAGSADVLIIKTNSSGVVQWSTTYGGTSWDIAYSIQQSSTGFIIVGYTGSFGAGGWADFLAFAINTSGNVQWARIYGGSGWDEAYSIQQTSDGGFIMAGGSTSFGAGSYDFLVIKTNSSGVVQWSKTYGRTGYDFAYSIQQISSGYIIAGRTNSAGAGNFDILFVKTDVNGNIGSSCTATIQNPSISGSAVTLSTAGPILQTSTQSVGVSQSITPSTQTLNTGCITPVSVNEDCNFDKTNFISSGKGYINVEYPEKFNVKIYNVNGILIKEVIGNKEMKINVNKGVYFVVFEIEGRKIVKKVIVK